MQTFREFAAIFWVLLLQNQPWTSSKNIDSSDNPLKRNAQTHFSLIKLHPTDSYRIKNNRTNNTTKLWNQQQLKSAANIQNLHPLAFTFHKKNVKPTRIRVLTLSIDRERCWETCADKEEAKHFGAENFSDGEVASSRPDLTSFPMFFRQDVSIEIASCTL